MTKDKTLEELERELSDAVREKDEAYVAAAARIKELRSRIELLRPAPQPSAPGLAINLNNGIVEAV